MSRTFVLPLFERELPAKNSFPLANYRSRATEDRRTIWRHAVLRSCRNVALAMFFSCFAFVLSASAASTLSISTTSLPFGNVLVFTPELQTVTATSTGTGPVTISGASLTGAGFTLWAPSFPITLYPGQSTPLVVEFAPSAAGAVTGQLTITSSSSSNSTAQVALSGTGTGLSSFYCSTTTPTGAGTDLCTVTLGRSAPSNGYTVYLSSSNGAVAVPATFTVPANSTSGTFTANVSAVTKGQTATLTANGGNVFEEVVLNLSPSQGVAVAVSPASASISPGATQQFTASVTGTSDTAVTWTTSGTGCGGTNCGTISTGGLYTAPTTVPSPATVTITATSVFDPAESASSEVTIVPNLGATYYLAPGGNDSNDGRSSQTPWRTPNHSVNCGDTISAAAGDYPYGNFEGTFGTVTGSGHCFAFLKCATFDACYSIGTGADPTNGMIWVSKSHWWVQGFEVRNPSTDSDSSCFQASPRSAQTIIDVAFVDDIANGCALGGFVAVPYYAGGEYGVDYFTLISDIAYNGAQSNAECSSGTAIFEPVNYDNQSGTHIFIDQYFGWGNVEPSTCAGHVSSDGEGIILDTFNTFYYTGQSAVENAITVWNGTNGVEAFASATAPIYVKNVTSFANGAGSTMYEYCGEIVGQGGGTPLNGLFHATANIAKTNSATACGGNTYSAYLAGDLSSQNVVSGNWGYSAAGNNTLCWGTCTGFTFGPNNTFGTDPGFANPPYSTPAAPSCSGYASVPACMASMIHGMTATTPGTAGLGYQPVSSTSTYDPLYPQLLCPYSAQLAGLVTPGCSAQ